MNFLKTLKILIILTSLKSHLTSAKKDEFVKGRRFTAVECQPDNVTVKLHYCFIRPYTRRVATLNVGVTFVKALRKPFYVQFIENYRYGK